MIVTGGGLNMTSDKIEEFKGYYLTRQRFLALKFKQFFFKALFKHASSNKLILPRRFKNDNQKFFSWARAIRDKHWIVSIQKPLNDLKQIVGYVGRYTKRACLSEYKIEHVDQENIKIRYNDYKNTPKNSKPLQSIKSFTINQFFDELLQHVPIKKFKMVRYYGLYTSHYKNLVTEHISKTNQSKQTNQTNQDSTNQHWTDFEKYRKLELRNDKPDPLICPSCKTKMIFDAVLYLHSTHIDDS